LLSVEGLRVAVAFVLLPPPPVLPPPLHLEV